MADVSKVIFVSWNLPFLQRKDCSRRCERVMFCILVAMILVWTQGTSAGEIRPNLATVETRSDTQITVTWQLPSDEEVAHLYSVTPYHYELYIDDHLEYFGKDVVYVARRLTPDTMYYFKIRRCVENTNKCTQFSKILAGTTAQSQKRGFTKSFLQWMIICVLVTGLACTTAVIGVKISRKLWRSFLYKYDYTSQSVVRLPKHLDTTGDLDEVEPIPLCVNNPKEKLDQSRITSMIHVSFQKERYTKEQEIQENKLPLIFKEGGESNNADLEQRSTTEKSCSENLKNGEIPNQNDFDESSGFLTQKTENVSPGNCKSPIFELDLSSPRVNHTVHILEENKQKWSDDQLRAQQKDNEKHHVVRLEHNSLRTPPTVTREEPRDIVVAVDNSNIFIGAKECASALNPKERKRNIRVKIQQLVKVLERGRTLSRAFVQGSSPPSSEQVWEVYRRLGYCVDLEDRRGKDEQRVDEGLHLHIYKALCELSPRKLVIASGDGNKGKSEGATSLPGCAQAALEKGWLVEVHAWQHSLSMEWLKLSRKYPELVSIHHLDRYINHITFVDGKYGRRCQTFPTDFFKRIS